VSVKPIIIKDYKIKMRSFATSSLTMMYLGALGIVILIFFLPMITNQEDSSFFGPKMVLDTYTALIIFQYILIVFVTIIITARTIYIEKNKKTLDLLLCTDFSPVSIILGKFIVSVTHVLLLILASIPIMSVIFMYGGGSISNLIFLFSFYILTSIVIASICIFYSTLFEDIAICYIMTGLTGIIFIILTNKIILSLFFFATGSNNYTQQLKEKLNMLNPFCGFSSRIGGNSLPAIGDIVNYARSNRLLFGFEIRPWLANISLYLTCTIFFLILATKKIMPIKEKLLFKRKGSKIL